MRIGVVTTSFPREPGDPAGAFVAGFARWLREAGHGVSIIAAGPGTSSLDGLPVTRIAGFGLFYRGGAPDALAAPGFGPWAKAAAFQAALAPVVARQAACWDAAVSHWIVPSSTAVYAALIARRRQIPHLAIAHSSDVALLRRSAAGCALLHLVSRRAHLVYTARHLVLDGAPGEVVSMGVDAPYGDRRRGRKRFGLQGTTAVFLGRLVPVKGVDLLIDALPQELSLAIAGDGPLAAALAHQAARRNRSIRFIGEVRGEAKHDLLAAADLFVLPSRRLPDGRSEGMPTVLFEAMAAGLPVVATRSSGAEEVIEHGATGLLVDPNAQSLLAALASLACSPAQRRRLGRAARAVGLHHTWPWVAPRLAAFLTPAKVRSTLHTA